MSEPGLVPGFVRFRSPRLRTFQPASLKLANGELLSDPIVGYQTWGRLNERRDNVIWVCHALSGSSDAASWWNGLIGPGKSLDPRSHFIVCVNVLGSCYGSLGPQSTAPDGKPYGSRFPRITVGDMVEHQVLLARHLGIRKIQAVIGGSMGGFQALEWAVRAPDLVERIVVIASSWRQPAHALALAELQLALIRSDPKFAGGDYHWQDPPVEGLIKARQLGHLSYRSARELDQRFARRRRADGVFEVLSYLDHQGQKLCARFDAMSYVRISEALNAYEFSEGRGEPRIALSRIKQTALIVGVLSDALYPPSESHRLASYLPNAQLQWIDSVAGHDGFLLENESLAPIVGRFLAGVDADTPVLSKIAW
jgi:homoserine O-acetyltransferase